MTNQQTADLAWEHLAAGRLGEAGGLFAEVLASDANHPRALHGQGRLAQLAGQHEIAADLIGRSLRAEPRNAEGHFHLAISQQALGRLEDATRALRAALTLAPVVARYHAALGALLQQRGMLQQAASELRRASELDPTDPHTQVALASALAGLDDPAAGEAAARRAVALNPSLASAHLNLGHCLMMLGRIAAAVEAFRAALALDAQNAEAHFGLGSALLLRGDYEHGWSEYEWRFRTGADPVTRPEFRTRPWDGSDLGGKTLLVYSEQGLGDTIQFSRYIPLAAGRNARVLLRCPPSLVELMKSVDGVAEVTGADRLAPRFDAHVPLLSLPRLLNTTLQTIPSRVPYLHADPARIERWRSRLAGLPAGRRIGLCWAGSAGHPRDRARSIDPTLLTPLGSLTGVQWLSLQKISRPGSRKPPLALHDFTAELKDFADTAALVANLDLVISVDTSVAHLAGALARPVWMMVQFDPDWRWLLVRTDSPWYPSMRLFRQPARGAWEPVVPAVVDALWSFVGAGL
jgi:tetratricopeptide (TPR) repeat protein